MRIGPHQRNPRKIGNNNNDDNYNNKFFLSFFRGLSMLECRA